MYGIQNEASSTYKDIEKNSFTLQPMGKNRLKYRLIILHSFKRIKFIYITDVYYKELTVKSGLRIIFA